MIQQVIVVEGKSDIARVRQAVDADLIATGGYALRSAVIQDIRAAYEKRGIIILTDPDGPGEKIRSRHGEKSICWGYTWHRIWECQAVFAQAESFWDYTKGVGIRVGRVREKV